ncbi:pyruvate carboxylase [Nannochloropsis oceanica]
MGDKGQPLFTDVCSTDLLGFAFAGRSYKDQLDEAIAKTQGFCGVDVTRRTLSYKGLAVPVVWVEHNFAFLGGSLGCAEGERITRAFELAKEEHLPIVVQCNSGGARMQEGTLSLMQMAKVAVAVEALRRDGIPFLSVLVDPTYGGVSASYAMQADVRLAVADARIGFAGPAVILNTMCQMDQDFTELKGDGRVASDVCIKGGLARFGSQQVLVIGCTKGHTPQAMQASNYGMPAPAGYRTALRLFALAERFKLPIITLVDTCGAWPSFQAESDGQSEAIATNLTAMSSLTVPIVTVIVGEGGSGGALGIGMGNKIGMLSGAYFGVISPEGAASILGRYQDEAHKAQQFPEDCQALATAQQIYANQLQELGVVDKILYEKPGESFEHCPHLRASLRNFLADSLKELGALSADELINQRFQKYRAMGKYALYDEGKKHALLKEITAAVGDRRKPKKTASKHNPTPGRLLSFIAHETVHGERSFFKGKALLSSLPKVAPSIPCLRHAFEGFHAANGPPRTAKMVLDSQGPEAVASWVLEQKGVLVTDTTMRDAHQSLLATRVRTVDIVEGAKIANQVLSSAFSFECWGGATYDVCYRFLHEDPWERLEGIRKALPHSLLQMLVRGANAVGYTSYPDNVVEEFIALAAKKGIDLFRIFDCFNDVGQMKVSIDAVRKAGKIAEVCICYTGDVLTSTIYNVDYYRTLTQQCVAAGAHIIAIKDMAGLLKPRAAAPLMQAIKEVTNLPVHFHTHDTSGASIASAMAMANAGCHIIDFATAALANCTSQPSLNAFLAAMAGDDRDPGINYLAVEPYDMYWAKVREMYAPFECGMKSGTARVYDHEIPGGQYSNLMVQCQAMGIWDRWEAVLDMYRDVNTLFGDVVKVTPSSKCVGDLAIYLVTRGLSVADITDESKAAGIDFPASVIDLLEGRLGFPHRGFPAQVQKKLDSKWGIDATPEDVISSLLYPKVFADYLKFFSTHGPGPRFLPTPCFYYGMEIGKEFTQTFSLPSSLVKQELGLENNSSSTSSDDDSLSVSVTLNRVGPLRKGEYRTLYFSVNGQAMEVEVQDTSGEALFDGPMADKAVAGQVGSPMPGAVDKILVGAGTRVEADTPLCVIVAMKMEVMVKAPKAGLVEEVYVEEGGKVVEGALLMSIV